MTTIMCDFTTHPHSPQCRKRNWMLWKCECHDGCAESQAGQDRKRKNPIQGTIKVEEISKNIQERKLIWACDEKIGGLCRREGDWNGSGREWEDRNAKDEMVGQSESRSQGEGTVRGGNEQMSGIEVNVIIHGPHIKVGKR